LPVDHTSSGRGALDRSGERLERTELTIGFIALADCAPLVTAKERGFFRRQGLDVTLERQASWASVRDKVAHGLLDGAQMLAPMPLAATLGLEGVTAPMVVPMSLSLGGNAITVSAALHARMRAVDPEGCASRLGAARALRAVIRDGRRAGEAPLRFAVVYPCSAHYYQLCYWLAAAAIDPLRDVCVSVIPPAAMVRALAEGEIDGYSVGEPWNERAVELGVGVPLVSSTELWQSSPEKVFAVTRDWAEQHPATLRAVVRALLEAAAWLDRPDHRLEAVHVIAGESFVDAPVSSLAASLLRASDAPPDAQRARPVHVFHRHAATFPWISHGVWFLTQMLRWGQIEKPFALGRFAASVFRPDLYREAAAQLGVPAPEVETKAEGLHGEGWTLAARPEPIAMGPDRFIDGRVFRPEDPVGYLEGFEVSALRVRLDDLVACEQ